MAAIPDPAPGGYQHMCWSTTGPVYVKWVGDGPEPAVEREKRPRKRKAA